MSGPSATSNQEKPMIQLTDIFGPDSASLTDAWEIRQFEKGDLLWQIGDAAEFVGLVLGGEVALKKGLPSYGRPIIIEMLWEGEFFGQGCFEPGNRREMLAEVMQPCQLAMLTTERYAQLLESDPAAVNLLQQKIILSVSRRLNRMASRLTRLF